MALFLAAGVEWTSCPRRVGVRCARTIVRIATPSCGWRGRGDDDCVAGGIRVVAVASAYRRRRLAPSGSVTIATAPGSLCAARTREQVRPIMRDFVRLVADTRGLQLQVGDHAAPCTPPSPSMWIPRRRSRGTAVTASSWAAEGIRVLGALAGRRVLRRRHAMAAADPPGWIRGRRLRSRTESLTITRASPGARCFSTPAGISRALLTSSN